MTRLYTHIASIGFWLLLSAAGSTAQDSSAVEALTSDSTQIFFETADWITAEGEATNFQFYEKAPSIFLVNLARIGNAPYQPKGISRSQQQVLINGLAWNTVETNQSDFEALQPLYDISEVRISSGIPRGFAHSNNVNGNAQFSTTATSRPRKLTLNYAYAQGLYQNHLKAGYQTGSSNSKWAFSLGVNYKWSKEGIIKGTYGNNLAMAMALTKDFKKGNRLTLTLLGSQLERASAGYITKETALLTNDYNYNPYWGMQNGTIRNAQLFHSFLPTAILHYEGNIKTKTKFLTAVSFQKGVEKRQTLDWFHGNNPYPDYYQNLPSYYQFKGDLNTRDALNSQWTNKPFQIDWDQIYEENRVNRISAITGEPQSAIYVQAADVSEINRTRASILFRHQFNDRLKLTGAGWFYHAQNEQFRSLTDLLGGNFFVNLNQFAFQSYGQANGWEQYDLQNPNRKVAEDDKYYYHFQQKTWQGIAWTALAYQVRKGGFWISTDFTQTYFQRKGYYQNGLYPDASLGKSPLAHFYSAQLKAGGYLNLRGGHQILVSGIMGTRPPDFNQTFFDARFRNTITPNIKTARISAFEFQWNYLSEKIRWELSLFGRQNQRQTETFSFYHDDLRTQVHYLLTDVNTRTLGLEWAGRFQLFPSLKLNLLVAGYQQYYNSRPEVTAFLENNPEPLVRQQKIYWKNFIAASGPQLLLGMSWELSFKKIGFMAASGYWQGQQFAILNPARRTSEAIYLLRDPNQIEDILKQERLPGYYLLNLRLGKVIHVFHKKPKQSLIVTAGVNNLLNKKGYALWSREQLRFDYEEKNPALFPNKYLFGLGRTFSLQASYKF